MRVSITSDDLPALKDYLARTLSDHKPSHRIEAAARGLGFTTYAGMRTALATHAIVVEADDLLFCEQVDVPYERAEGRYNRILSRAIARIALHRVLNAHSGLTQCGFDSAWINSREWHLSNTERLALLAERRQEAFEDDWSFDQFELAWIYLSRQNKIRTINRRTSSYGLKHRAEDLSRSFGMFTPLGDYVSNGMLIAAAYALGFTVKPIGRESYNAHLNISMLTVKQSRGYVRGARENPELVRAMYGGRLEAA